MFKFLKDLQKKTNPFLYFFLTGCLVFFNSKPYTTKLLILALGGMFIKTLKETLEAWDVNQEF